MSAPAGVHRRLDDGRLLLVHEYVDDHYELMDVKALFDLGEVHGDALVLERAGLRQLKAMADAESFDHAPEFISMCLDIAATVLEPGQDELHLVSVE